MAGRKGTRGSVMIEFALAGVASLFLLISTVYLCMGLWRYHTLAYAVHEATRYVASHGRGCVTSTTSCAITVRDIVTRLTTDSVGLGAGDLNLTLTTESGSVMECNPVTICSNSAVRWPPTSNLDNFTGKKITLTASFRFTHSMLIYWPGAGLQRLSAVTLPASSTETIVF